MTKAPAGQERVGRQRTRRYPAYKDFGVEWLGLLPKHWEVKRLWHLTQPGRRIMYGIVLPGPDVDDGVPIVKGGDVSAGRLSLDKLSRTTREIEASYARSRLKGGDLVYAIRGSIGEVALVPHELEGANLTQDAARVSYTSAIHGPWLLHTLASAPVFAQLESGALGATIRGINIRDLKRAAIPLPPPAEQRAIATFLDRETAKIDHLVAKKERLIELLQEKRAALISRAVTKGFDPNVPMKDSGVEWIGRIPEHWQVRRLKTIATVQLSNVDKKSAEGQVPVRLCNYVDVYYNAEIDSGLDFMSATATPDQVRKFSLRIGDVLITKDSESWTDIAVPALVTQDLPDVLCGYHLALIRPAPACLGAFLAHSFSAIGPREQFRVAANGVTRFGLGGDAIREAFFAMPPVEEQRAICSYIDHATRRFEALAMRVRDGIARAKELRTALISAAVTGKIDVRDAA